MIGLTQPKPRRAGLACIWAVGAMLIVEMLVPERAMAQDDSLAEVLVDGFYGGLIGALVGTAVMALTEHKREHLSYITTGAAIGAIGGTVYGLYNTANRAMAEMDRGRVTWTLPSLAATATDDGLGRGHLTYSAAFFRYRFE